MFDKCAVFAALLMAVTALGTIDVANGEGGRFLHANADAQRVEKRSRPQGGSSNDDFERFFLKASKSVPRIGRRRIEEQTSDVRLPLWAELSDLYEYNPELFASPQLLARWLEYYNSQLPHEDAKAAEEGSAGGWPATLRFKRERSSAPTMPAGRELYEYRLQP